MCPYNTPPSGHANFPDFGFPQRLRNIVTQNDTIQFNLQTFLKF